MTTGPAPAPPVRVVLVEDQPLLLDLLASALESRGLDVVARAADAASARARIAALVPDLVVLDIRLTPEGRDDGIRLAELLRREHPGTGLLALSAHLDLGHARRLLRLDRPARGVGYLLKDRVADVDRLVDAAVRVAGGDVVLDPEILDRLTLDDHGGTDAVDRLTAHERRVLALLAEGLSNHGIADRLGCRTSTVEKHVSVVARKLGLPAGNAADRSGVNVRVLAARAFLRAEQV